MILSTTKITSYFGVLVPSAVFGSSASSPAVYAVFATRRILHAAGNQFSCSTTLTHTMQLSPITRFLLLLLQLLILMHMAVGLPLYRRHPKIHSKGLTLAANSRPFCTCASGFPFFSIRSCTSPAKSSASLCIPPSTYSSLPQLEKWRGILRYGTGWRYYLPRNKQESQETLQILSPEFISSARSYMVRAYDFVVLNHCFFLFPYHFVRTRIILPETQSKHGKFPEISFLNSFSSPLNRNCLIEPASRLIKLNTSLLSRPVNPSLYREKGMPRFFEELNIEDEIYNWWDTSSKGFEPCFSLSEVTKPSKNDLEASQEDFEYEASSIKDGAPYCNKGITGGDADNVTKSLLLKHEREADCPDNRCTPSSALPDSIREQNRLKTLAESKNITTFYIPMPPPNLTGALHIGHALFIAIQDTLIRFHRMRGKLTLWIPGTDHGGIATNIAVSRQPASSDETLEGAANVCKVGLDSSTFPLSPSSPVSPYSYLSSNTTLPSSTQNATLETSFSSSLKSSASSLSSSFASSPPLSSSLSFDKKWMKWKAKIQDSISYQMKKMAASACWSRQIFSLDPRPTASVEHAFVRLFEKGLIYRSNYIVNWVCSMQTAVSDLEVTTVSVDDKKLYRFKYYLEEEEGADVKGTLFNKEVNGREDILAPGGVKGLHLEHNETLYNASSPSYLEVATTRPETLFADVALCVHPNDKRYSHLIGRKARVPFSHFSNTTLSMGCVCSTQQNHHTGTSFLQQQEVPALHPIERRGLFRVIPIIADESVDPTFGTGVMKVSPAHDKQDFLIANRHGLHTCLQAFGFNGLMKPLAGPSFAGIDRLACRSSLWKRMVSDDIAVQIDHKFKGSIRTYERTGEIIEPMISRQWFLKSGALAQRAKAVVEQDEIVILPNSYKRLWTAWADELEDWCISRQIRIGHRIPVWKVESSSEAKDGGLSCEGAGLEGYSPMISAEEKLDEKAADDEERLFVVAHDEIEALEKAKKLLGTDNIVIPPASNAGEGSAAKFEGEDSFSIDKGETEGNERESVTRPGKMSKNFDCDELCKPSLESCKDSNQIKDGKSEYKNPRPLMLKRSTDVLDTWFSSSLWPLSVLGWPNLSGENPETAQSSLVEKKSKPAIEDGSFLSQGGGDDRPSSEGFKARVKAANLSSANAAVDVMPKHSPSPDAISHADGRVQPQPIINYFERFFPASLLETGYDILFVWVARMVMLSLELTDSIPFKRVYLHGLIRDPQGLKMSKSKGNAVNPLEAIKKYGYDPLRFALISAASSGQDITLIEDGLKSASRFGHKVWNIGRFIWGSMRHVDSSDYEKALREVSYFARYGETRELTNSFDIPQRFILSKLSIAVQKVTSGLENFELHHAAKTLQKFLNEDFSDWYLPICSRIPVYARSDESQGEDGRLSSLQSAPAGLSAQPGNHIPITRKISVGVATLFYAWECCLKMLHPFVPFLSEFLYQLLPKKGSCLMLSPWPKGFDDQVRSRGKRSAFFYDEEAVKTFSAVKEVVGAIRKARVLYKLDKPPKKRLGVCIHSRSSRDLKKLQEVGWIIQLLGHLSPDLPVEFIDELDTNLSDASTPRFDNFSKQFFPAVKLGEDLSVRLYKAKYPVE